VGIDSTYKETSTRKKSTPVRKPGNRFRKMDHMRGGNSASFVDFVGGPGKRAGKQSTIIGL